MIPNSRAFDGKTFFEYEGKTFYRWHHIRKTGSYTLRFRIISTKSPHRQGIALFFSDFKGKLWLNDEPLPVLKGKFQHYTFKVGEITDNVFTLMVKAENGSLVFANASERIEIESFTCGAFASAFWIETLGNDRYRFHCNDHEEDDDFDDLIFDMEIGE